MEGSSRAPNAAQKDPRRYARRYQLDLCKRAVEENIIVYLGTGCGKTHIAVMLMYELGHLIRKPSDRVCVFLAPTIPLIQQQAMVIEKTTDFKVRSYYGNCRHLKDHDDWKREIEQYEVLVMIPQIFLYNLQHCLICMDKVALLIFDECHHAQAHKRHPYALIMKEFYKPGAEKRPHIFGMTASPITGKGGTDQINYTKCINSLESLLDAKVCSIDDTFELESVAPSPDIKVYLYGPVLHDTASPNFAHCNELDQINKQCISMLREKLSDNDDHRKQMKLLWRQHDTLIFCLQNIGLYGAMIAARILLDSGGVDLEKLDRDDGDADNHIASLYLTKAMSLLSSNLVEGEDNAADSLSLDVLEEPFFSMKLLSLIRILAFYRLTAKMKCIIFVKRIIVAKSLATILGNIKFLDFWKCDFLVGCNSGTKNMSRTKMKSIVHKFSSGEVNLLVATNVAEEGLDIQTCNLVVRFDLPDTVASFIQSRGRARMMKSSCIFLVERGNRCEEKLLNDFMSGEEIMNTEVNCRTSDETFDDLEEIFYKVLSTGASISAGSSVSLLHCYCNKLPKDQYFDPLPKFFYIDDANSIICRVSLPPNAPIRFIDSPPCQTKEEAKRNACLNACKRLHELGALSDYLLPGLGDGRKKRSDTMHVKSDSIEASDESSKEELHEMIIPAVLKESWNANDCPINLHSYCIKIIPIPKDRQYRMFGLFMKSSLPKEAETLELDLHLAHGRIVKTGFIALGMQKFDKEEILLAQDFQAMFLKIILDRSEFFSDVVDLGNLKEPSLFFSKFYLLLPLKQQRYDEIMEVDWTTVRRCLASPVFGHMGNIYEKGHDTTTENLVLLNGVVSKADIVDSLVFTPHNKLFLFVDDILPERDADSQHKVGRVASHAEYYQKRFKIRLSHPKQPLLKAKQLFLLHNLLHNRIQQNTGEARELEEHFVEIPAELCSLKIFSFSKDIGSTISLLPSLMHRLESLLAAIELKDSLSKSFPEASEIRADHILEALTTEKCLERFSLERFEVLGDSFLKYVVGRHSFLAYEGLDEGQLTKRRSSLVNNSNLYELAITRNLQVYIHDELFDPMQFFALGRPCQIICNTDTEFSIHGQGNRTPDGVEIGNRKCTKSHRWLHRKVIADVVEALVGAFLVGSGFKAAIAFLQWIGLPVDFDVCNVYRAWELSKNNMSLLDMTNVNELEELLSHRFSYKGLLLQAFVHPSFNRHSGGCYQKLEFLGDAVLEYLITSYLYSAYPDLKPGQITDLRSLAVNNISFAHIAVQRCLHKYIIMDSKNLSEAIKKFENFIQLSDREKDLLEEPTCPKVLGDIVESCIGAVLLDSGFNLMHAWRLMVMLLEPTLSFSTLQFNPTRELRELCQFCAFELKLPDPKKVKGGYFVEVEVVINGEILNFNSINQNSRAARKIASQEALSKLKVRGYKHKSKSLEEVLRLTQKKEAKLIGFDEEPIVINDAASGTEPIVINDAASDAFERLTLEDAPAADMLPQQESCVSSSGVVNSNLSESVKKASTSAGITGTSNHKMARSQLVEVCSARKWKSPCFQCLSDEGPSHLRMFTYKVTVEIDGSSPTTLECFSEPKPTKKAAQEHAAEGAMWFLQHRGYIVPLHNDILPLGFPKHVRLS